MKLFYKILCAAQGGEGAGADATTKDRAVKSGMVKVRATGQPVSCDGVLIGNGKADAVEIDEKHLKRLGGLVTKVACVALLLTLFVSPASAQVYTSTSLSSVTNSGWGTNTFNLNGGNGTNQSVRASSATFYRKIIPVTKFEQVGIGIAFALNGAGSGTATANFSLDWSDDATNWQMNAVNIQVPTSGTTTVPWHTNVYVGSIGYLRLNYATNANATADVTNLNFKVDLKPVRFGQ